jgi:hypothetical protein
MDQPDYYSLYGQIPKYPGKYQSGEVTMNETQARTLPLGMGKKTTLKFDQATWRAIDLVASRDGLRWTEWARRQMAANASAENMHAAVRAAAVDALLAQNIIAERADQLTGATPPLLASAGTLDDDQLAQELSNACVDAGPFDLGGFAVRVGSDGDGRACIWIENMLKGCPHYAIPLPFSSAEIAFKVGAIS